MNFIASLVRRLHVRVHRLLGGVGKLARGAAVELKLDGLPCP